MRVERSGGASVKGLRERERQADRETETEREMGRPLPGTWLWSLQDIRPEWLKGEQENKGRRSRISLSLILKVLFSRRRIG